MRGFERFDPWINRLVLAAATVILTIRCRQIRYSTFYFRHVFSHAVETCPGLIYLLFLFTANPLQMHLKKNHVGE